MVSDWLAGIFLIAIVYMLVKPSSPAADAVHLFGEAMVSLVSTVTKP